MAERARAKSATEAQGGPTFPRGRLDGLTDGVFAFAMTLLVINLEIPGDFVPTSNRDLLDAFRQLDSPLIAYVITFMTLALRWLGQARTRGQPEVVTGSYVWAVLLLLFFVTLMPFTTLMAGRYDTMPAAIWLYAGNLILSSIASLRIATLVERQIGAPQQESGRIELYLLIASALLSIAISLVLPSHAMWAYILNAFGPLVRRMVEGRLGKGSGW